MLKRKKKDRQPLPNGISVESKYVVEREHPAIRNMLNRFLDILEKARLDYLTSGQVEHLLDTKWHKIKKAIKNGWISPLRKNKLRPGGGRDGIHGIYSVYEAAYLAYLARRPHNITKHKLEEIHAILAEEIQKRIESGHDYWTNLAEKSLRKR